jgi:hypothetical protein
MFLIVQKTPYKIYKLVLKIMYSIYKEMDYHKTLLLFFLALQLSAGNGLLVHEVS